MTTAPRVARPVLPRQHDQPPATVDRLNRRIATVKREVALDAVRRLPRCGDVTARFSRYAGCSCPCSPGVVLSRPVYLEVGGVTRQVDFWVETLPRVEVKSA